MTKGDMNKFLIYVLQWLHHRMIRLNTLQLFLQASLLTIDYRVYLGCFGRHSSWFSSESHCCNLIIYQLKMY
jgi:hypothetical protein